MTSNIGSHYIMERMEKMNENNREEILEKTREEVLQLLKQTIRPEFLNRIDEIVMFAPLTRDEIKDIVRMQIDQVIGMMKNNNLQLEVSDSAVEWIAAAGYDPQFGARPVKRLLQKALLNELSRKILSGEIKPEVPIRVNQGLEGLQFSN